MTFLDSLLETGRRNHSLLCVGLDPDARKLQLVQWLWIDPSWR
jgi:hypothetical protein